MTSVGEESSRSERERLRCFVIGPIGSQFAEAGSEARQRYEEAVEIVEEVIEPACTEAGLTPIRADGLARAGEITEQVFRRLRDDDVVIADLTDANPNVMYELGLRHTQDKLTVQVGEYGRLPFDITVIRTIQFSRSRLGLIRARQELVRILESGLAGEFDPVTATRVWNRMEEAGADSGMPRQTEAAAQHEQEDQAEPPGFMDLIGEAEQYQEPLNDAINSIGERLVDLSSLTENATQQMSQSDARGAGMRGRLAVLASFAHDLGGLAGQVEENVNDYESSMSSVSAGMLAIIERL